MLKVNEYFEGKVKSIAVENAQGKSTVGVMDVGEFEFGTNTIEHMTVITGLLTVLLPNATEWKDYQAGETFVVPANTIFKLKVPQQTAYLCRYE
ncbi:MAG: pyrimidine/purine nucleoside phosphorylase [Candidatus Cloacimonetes bacterium]|nr:pyrimidine/purine nucleoside phosphorylase [Candidatus Cloacimonadota bacterium]